MDLSQWNLQEVQMNLTNDFWAGLITGLCLLMTLVIVVWVIRYNSVTVVSHPKEAQKCAIQYGKILSCFSGEESGE